MEVKYVILIKQLFERVLSGASGLQTDVAVKMEHNCKPSSLVTEEQQACSSVGAKAKQRIHDYRLF